MKSYEGFHSCIVYSKSEWGNACFHFTSNGTECKTWLHAILIQSHPPATNSIAISCFTFQCFSLITNVFSLYDLQFHCLSFLSVTRTEYLSCIYSKYYKHIIMTTPKPQLLVAYLFLYWIGFGSIPWKYLSQIFSCQLIILNKSHFIWMLSFLRTVLISAIIDSSCYWTGFAHKSLENYCQNPC